MSNFDINYNPPQQGPTAIPWLKEGLRTLWRKVDRLSGGGSGLGGGSGEIIISDLVLLSYIGYSFISGRGTAVPLFPSLAHPFVPTGLWIMVTSLVPQVGPPISLPISSIGWDEGAGGPPDYQQILPDTPTPPSLQTTPYDITPPGKVPVVPRGLDLSLFPTQNAGGFDAFLGNIYLTGYYIK